MTDLTGVQEIPRFKRKRRSDLSLPAFTTPRYAPVMGLAWCGALVIAILHLLHAIRGTDPRLWDWHRVADAWVAVALLVTISYLWAAWEREENYPELLPKKEFDRRYPPSSAAPPARSGQKLVQSGVDAIPVVTSSTPPPPPPPSGGKR